MHVCHLFVKVSLSLWMCVRLCACVRVCLWLIVVVLLDPVSTVPIERPNNTTKLIFRWIVWVETSSGVNTNPNTHCVCWPKYIENKKYKKTNKNVNENKITNDESLSVRFERDSSFISQVWILLFTQWILHKSIQFVEFIDFQLFWVLFVNFKLKVYYSIHYGVESSAVN